MDPQIVANIKGELALNQPKEKIIGMLKIQGYAEEAIQAAFAEVERGAPPSPVETSQALPLEQARVQAVSTMPAGNPPVSTMPMQTTDSTAPASGSSAGKIATLIIAVLFVTGAGAGFAYYKNLGPFAVKQYTEDTLLGGILEKAKGISKAGYKSSVAVTVVPREKDAVPFVPKEEDPNLEEKYKNDYKTFSSISSLRSSLSYNYGSRQAYDYAEGTTKTIPAKGFPDKPSSSDIRYANLDASKYSYRKTEGGSNFAITATFDTQQAIDGIRKSSGYSATSTLIDGRTVTLTKDSTRVYIPSQLPKPFILELAEYLRYVSPEMSATVEFGATADMSKETTSDWKANVSAVGNMGDLSYSVDVEGRKKDSKYYVRINKMPSVLSFVNVLKGQWIVFDTSATSSTSYVKSFSKAESAYKENRSRFADSLRWLANQADKDKLIRFKNLPKKEKVEGRTLYRYDLEINKSAVVPFYQHLMEESQKYKELGIILNDSTLTYLKGEEFDHLFDYIQENTDVTLWTDPSGYPAVLEYKMRVVPQSSMPKLADKQVDVVFRLSLDDINAPVSIDTPEDARTWEQMQENLKKNSAY